MITQKQNCIIIVTAAIFLAVVFPMPYAEASGSGLTTIGAHLSYSADDLHLRQLVEMERIGDAIVGRPEHGPIRLVVIDAPGFKKASLILRESNVSDSAKSILLSMPDDIAKKIMRTTLFIEPAPKHKLLAEYKNGEWVTHKAGEMRNSFTDAAEMETKELYAFHVESAGPFLLFSEEQDVLPLIAHQMLPDSPRHSDAAWLGLRNIGYPILFLIIGVLISRLFYAVNRRMEEG